MNISFIIHGRFVPSLLLALQIVRVFGTAVEAEFTMEEPR